MVILSTVRSDSLSDFVKDRRRLCVALSRARYVARLMMEAKRGRTLRATAAPPVSDARPTTLTAAVCCCCAALVRLSGREESIIVGDARNFNTKGGSMWKAIVAHYQKKNNDGGGGGGGDRVASLLGRLAL